MECLVSGLTKREFKNWKSLFQNFFQDSIYNYIINREEGLSYFLKGLFFDEGFHCEKDHILAGEYFQKGALDRDPLCLYKLYEIYSGKNNYGVTPNEGFSLLYLVWSIVYSLLKYGSHILLDFDMEFQYYYKNVAKQDKNFVLNIIKEAEDGIFKQDKEFVIVVFDYLLESISQAKSASSVQMSYNNTIDCLIRLTEKGFKYPTILLFQLSITEFQNITDRRLGEILQVLRKTNIIYIYDNFKNLFEILNIINQKHPIFAKLLRNTAIELFWQIKSHPLTKSMKIRDEFCYFIAENLFKHLHLIDSLISKIESIGLMAKCYQSGIFVDRNLKKAIDVLEITKTCPGYTEDSFPYFEVGKIYQKLKNKEEMTHFFKKWFEYAQFKKDLPHKFFQEGVLQEIVNQDIQKAVDSFIKGLYSPTALTSFQQELYKMKCQKKLSKLIVKYPQLRAQLNDHLQESIIENSTKKNYM